MANISTEADDQEDDVSDGRGPAYPKISLEKAVERADAMRAAGVARTALPSAGLLKIWGYKGSSGPARRQLAAVKYYGLLDTIGTGKERKFRLSELALKIVLDKVPDSPGRAAALREAALKPPIFSKLLDAFPLGIGTDAGIETYLTLNCGYNEEAAKSVMVVFRDTLHYAGLDKAGDLALEANRGSAAQEPKFSEKTKEIQDIAVGDLIQVEIEGVLQLEKAVRVRAIQDHEGKKWVFVDGSEAGVPMEQVVLEKKGAGASSDLKPPTLALPSDPPPAKGIRKEVITLDEGDVILTFPESLSAASFHDLEGHLQLFLRKAQRRAGAGDYFAEVYARDGFAAKEVQYFDSFSPLLKFMAAFKARNSTDILRVHLPARATDEERRIATESGGRLVL